VEQEGRGDEPAGREEARIITSTFQEGQQDHETEHLLIKKKTTKEGEESLNWFGTYLASIHITGVKKKKATKGSRTRPEAKKSTPSGSPGEKGGGRR